MTLGRSELVAKLAARIEQEGPLPFADFMEAALYDPDFGYYMTPGTRIGRDGDYYTSPDVHPLFAELIGRQIAQAAEIIAPFRGEGAHHPLHSAEQRVPAPLPDPPDAFTIVEMGAGKGLLARHLLNSYRRENPAFLSRLRYLVVERSPALVSLQRQLLQSLVDEGVGITWIPNLEALPAGSLTGIILSNELVDAFAVHRVVKRPLGLREIFVGWDSKARFIEIEAPPSSHALQAYFDRIGVSLKDGQRAEVNLRALDWMRQVGALLNRGLVLTIDYGHTARDLYAPTRKAGTLLCYHRHTVSDTPYLRVGEQDMTAHVDFTSLALAGLEAGLEVTGFTNQLHFLLGLGIESAFAGLDPESPECAGMRSLLRPEGMGATYKILVQHKGIAAPELDGLRSKPYFPGALLAGVANMVAVAP